MKVVETELLSSFKRRGGDFCAEESMLPINQQTKQHPRFNWDGGKRSSTKRRDKKYATREEETKMFGTVCVQV
jgi:hypothetical protein